MTARCSGHVRRCGEKRPCVLPSGHYGMHVSKALATTSGSRAEQLKVYAQLRNEFLARPGNRLCQCPRGCTKPATTIQHLRGRQGERLNDTAWWKASCLDCNLWAEDHTGEALACGWLVPINGSAA